MNKKILIVLAVVVLVVLVIGIILSVKMPQSLSTEEKTEITALVEGFGKKIVKVDKIAPNEEVAKSIKENYSTFLSSNLILEWSFNPSKALGRTGSSPWPDRIEILSMKKLGANTVKVKGYVVWVASGGENNIEIAEKVPTVLIVKRNSSTQKFLIDNVYSNEFAFYDGKILLETLKKAFPNMHSIGERYEPYVQMVIMESVLSEPFAVVDMGTGGAYTKNYTLCLLACGHLETVDFEQNDGHIAPLFFEEGASVKHEAKLGTFDDDKGNFILYQSIIDKNDLGAIDNITVEAYKWNEEKKLFEYSIEYSEKIKKELEEQLVLKSIEISSLKFKEIQNKYSAIGSVAVYNGKVAISTGSGYLEVNNPTSANINHVLVYNTSNGKLEYSSEVSKEWVNIDSMQMNDNWILFRVVENPVGAPANCFVIDRATGKLVKLLQNYSWNGDSSSAYMGFTVDQALLQDNYAYLALEDMEVENGGKRLSSKGESRFVGINLNNGTTQEFFTNKGVFHLWALNNDGVAFSTSQITEEGVKKEYVYLYNFEEGRLDSITLPDYIDVYVLTRDEHIIYYRNGKVVIAPLRKPEVFEEILKSPNAHMLVGSTVSSSDYIVAGLDNGNIFVFNRKTKERSIITGRDVNSEIALNGYELCFIKHSEGRNDYVIYLDLKENGF